MKRYFLFLFLFQIPLLIFSQSDNQRSIDSLLFLIKNSEENSAKVDLLNQISLKYWEKGLEEGADSLHISAVMAMQLASQLKYKEGLALPLFNLGKYHISLTHDYAEATPLLIESLALYEELNDKKGIAKCYLQLGLISYILQYYEDAIKNFKLAIDNNVGPTANYLMALSYSELNNYPQSKKYFASAIEIYKERNDQKRINECYTFMGKLFLNMEQLDSAFYYLNQAIIHADINDKYAVVRPYAFISSVYLKNNEIDKAIYYADKSYKMVQEMSSDNFSLIEATNTLSKAYEMKGEYKKAHFFLDLLNTTKLEAFKGSTKQKVADMQSRHDYNKKINEQKVRQEKDKEIAQQQIQKQKILRNAFLSGAALLLLLLALLYNRFAIKRDANLALQEKNEIISYEKDRSDNLLLNILPSAVAEELKEKGSAEAKQFNDVTVMFTDFKDFTNISENLSPSELVSEIDTCFKAFDNIISKHNVEKIKTIGDSYMCVGGMPIENKTHVKDVVQAAIDIQEFMYHHNQERSKDMKPKFEIRIGLHTGPVVAGIVGLKKFQYDIWGDTVNTASRMESSGEAGKINISAKSYQLLKNNSSFAYESRGKIEAKGKGEMEMYFVRKA